MKMENKNILTFKKEAGQSIAEYAIMFVAVVAVMFFAINGPVRDSLNSTFGGVIHAVGNGINALIP